MCVYVCLREWVGCSGVHGVYYWSPAVLHLSLFTVVKHEAKSLLNLGAHSRTHTHTHTQSADLCILSQFQEIRADTNTRAAKMSI